MDDASNGRVRSKLASFKEACKPSSIYLRVKGCDVHTYMVTFWACLGFIGLGSSLLVFGPTLLDLAEHLGVGVDVLAIMFTCRGIGGALGSVGSGILFDKLGNYHYTLLCIICVFCIATTAVVPLSVHVVMLGVFMTLNGVFTGSIDNGVHAVLIKLWRDKAGPCMQILHFCFAFGAFIAPLVAKQFVSETTEQSFNMTEYENLTFKCGELLNDSSIDFNLDYSNIEVTNITLCVEDIKSACHNLSESTLLTVADNCTISTEDNTQNFAWAYWITSTFFVPSLVAFIYFAATRETRHCCKRKKLLQVSNEENEVEEKKESKERVKQSRWFLILMFSLLFVFMFLYVGLEVTYGSLIFTVSVKGELNFAKQDAAILTALFWGTFAFTRLFSVLLAVLNVRSSMMMVGNLSGSFLASLILIFYPHNSVAVWIGSGVLGASYASIYPTTMTWMSENTVATGKATSVLVAAGTLGDITIPSIVGVIVARASPDSLFYITFGGVLLSSMVVIVLFLVTCLYNRKAPRTMSNGCSKKTDEAVKYRRLNGSSEGSSELEHVDIGTKTLNRVN